jgi:hypothetical protein
LKNHVLGYGSELEGYWNNGNQPENFKHDGSVHFENYSSNDCDGDCQECYCFDDCDCDSCIVCTECEYNPNSCECHSCLTCDDCENHIDNCDCDREEIKQDSCKDKECDKNNVCDDCINICQDNFDELQNISHNCSSSGNLSTQCDRDCDCSCECECQCNNDNVGETSSPILKSVKETSEWISNNYCDEINSSCGFHQHKSFKNDKQAVHVLASITFHNWLNSSLKKWAIDRNINSDSRFFKRLEGMEYCQNVYDGDKQLAGESHNRYTQINFCSYAKINTVEFRVGNMFDKKEITIEYMAELDRLVNLYLNTNKPKVWKFDLNVNNEISIHLELSMVKTGLRIFAKGFGIENKIKSSDYSHYNKYRLYHSEDSALETNINQLYNSEGDVNLCFLRLVGLKNGKSMILPNVFTVNQIEQYLYDLQLALPRVLRRLRGLKICV